jgi:CDP-glucose 4,6-dehydratase
MNILVTGGNGLLGSNLINYLSRKKQNKIYVLDKLKKNQKNKNKIKIIKSNFENFNEVKNVIKKFNINVIFHLGAQTQVLKALNKPYETLVTNVVGTLNFLEAIRVINKKIIFIYSSSDKAYGEANKLGYKESTILGGSYPYDVSKSASDLICQSYSKTYDLKIGIIRCANIFGPNDKNLKRIIPETITSIIKGKKLKIRSNGKSLRNYIYVEDVCEAYEKLMLLMTKSKKYCHVYNIGSKINLNPKKLALAIYSQFKIKPDIVIENNSKQEINFQKLNYAKAIKDLKWLPKTSLKVGLKNTIEWYKKNY